jgi:hypothetical protein
MSMENLVELLPQSTVIDGIPFRLERGNKSDLATGWWAEDNLLEHGLIYRCHVPLYKYGYRRDGLKWVPGRENVIEEQLSTAVIQWNGRAAIQFQSNHSAHVVTAESFSDRLLRLIFLWERDFDTRPRSGGYYYLGAFLKWLEERVDAGEKLSHEKPFLFEDWRQYGPHDEAFQQVRNRRERLLSAGDTSVLVEPVSLAAVRAAAF